MPSPFVPKPELGIHLTSVIVYGLNEDNEGGLTIGTTVVIGTIPPAINNVIRHVNATDSPGHQEINAMNTRQRNQVIIDDGAGLSLQIYRVNNGRDMNPLKTLFQTYDNFYVEWTEGTVAGAIYTSYYYGCRGDLDLPTEGRGEQLCTATFMEIDPGAPEVPQFTSILTG